VELIYPGRLTREYKLLLSQREQGKYGKFVMAVCGGNSKESFFEMNTSNAVFQSQMILKQKPVEIGVFP